MLRRRTSESCAILTGTRGHGSRHGRRAACGGQSSALAPSSAEFGEMIDRTAGDAAARALALFAEGVISSAELEKELPGKSKDRIVDALHVELAKWFDDWVESRIDCLPPDELELERTNLRRCIRFLKTDLEFEWPLCRLFAAFQALWANTPKGDRSVWPFYRRVDFERTQDG